MPRPSREVPCDGCTLCCRQEIITLHTHEGDNPADYIGGLSTRMVDGKLVFQLMHKPNGDCIFLSDAGCEVYEKRPAICRTFDCRRAYVKITHQYSPAEIAELEKNGGYDPPVFERGRELLPTLDPMEANKLRRVKPDKKAVAAILERYRG